MSFFDITVDDINIPENITFVAGKPVKLLIKDFRELPEKEMIIVEMKVLDGEMKDRIHQMFVSKKAKRDFAKFILTFWTREQIQNKTFRTSDISGKVVEVMFAPPVERNGRTFQSFVSMTLVGGDAVKNIANVFGSDVPF